MDAVRCGRLIGWVAGLVVGSRGLVGIVRRRCRSRGGMLIYLVGTPRHLLARRWSMLALWHSVLWYDIFVSRRIHIPSTGSYIGDRCDVSWNRGMNEVRELDEKTMLVIEAV